MIFVYKTINTITGKYYIGVHDGDLEDNYLGSGKYLNAAIKKYGRENFKREILHICDSKEKAYLIEKRIVTPELISSGNVYNLNTGGHGGWHHAIKRGDENWTRQPGASEKISKAVKNSITPEMRLERSKRMSQLRNDGTIIKPVGWTHSEESKKKMSENLKGKVAWNKGIKTGEDSIETKKKKSEAAKRRSAQQDMGALTRGKTYNMREMKCPHCGLVGKGGNMTRFHFDNCKINHG